jgi:hypothetical protein
VDIRYEGEALVVDSKNCRGGLIASYQLSPRAHFIEGLTRVAPNILMYEYTLDDPATLMRPWTARIPMAKTDERIYEYACQEGNYSLPNILAGARKKERAAEQRMRSGGK